MIQKAIMAYKKVKTIKIKIDRFDNIKIKNICIRKII